MTRNTGEIGKHDTFFADWDMNDITIELGNQLPQDEDQDEESEDQFGELQFESRGGAGAQGAGEA